MSKIWLIIKREYLTRVRNKTFIISTIMLPLFFMGFIVAAAYFSIQSESKQTIAVNDHNGIFKNSFKSDKNIVYDFPGNVDAGNFKQKGYSALLNIPEKFDSKADTISLISNKPLGIAAEERIKDQINLAIKNRAFLQKNVLFLTLVRYSLLIISQILLIICSYYLIVSNARVAFVSSTFLMKMSFSEGRISLKETMLAPCCRKAWRTEAGL